MSAWKTAAWVTGGLVVGAGVAYVGWRGYQVIRAKSLAKRYAGNLSVQRVSSIASLYGKTAPAPSDPKQLEPSKSTSGNTFMDDLETGATIGFGLYDRLK